MYVVYRHVRYLSSYLNSVQSFGLLEYMCLVPFEVPGVSNDPREPGRGFRPYVRYVSIRRGSWRSGIIIYGI